MTTEHHASEEYEARLEQTHESPLKAAARWAVAVASAAFHDSEVEPHLTSVVVYATKDESRVLTLQAGNLEEAERLVELVRKDLNELSTEEFLEEWGQGDVSRRS